MSISLPRSGSVVRRVLRWRVSDWPLVVAAALAAMIVLATEPDWWGVRVVAAAFALVWTGLYGLTSRARFSFLLTLGLAAWIWAGAWFKFSVVAMNLHVYDVAFYLSSLSQIVFFGSAFPRLAMMSAAGGALALGLLVLAWRSERRGDYTARQRLAIFAAALAVMAGESRELVGRNVDFFTPRHSVYSAFFSSFADLPQLVAFHGLMEVAAAPSTGPIPAGAIVCDPKQTPPDIVLFLNESAMPPGVYPGLAYPDELKPFFASQDGAVRPFRVETFGGGTWLTDFTVLTGLSTRSFGTLRNFVAQFMTGRLRHSLPQYLKACGYETTMIYPASSGFAGVGRFYKAIGFDRVIDRSVHHAPDERQRDAFYLDQAAQVIETAATSGRRKPQFVVASSMSTHSPWDFRFAPDAVRPGEKLRWNGDPEFDEYLWRLVLARRDRDDMHARLARTASDRHILYVDYGDHQPALARVPLEQGRDIADNGQSWQLDPLSKAFETYYAINAQGFAPALPPVDLPILEAANLATVTVMAAGLPLDAVYERRRLILEECRGLYSTCPDKAAILTFQRWLGDSGWVAQR